MQDLLTILDLARQVIRERERGALTVGALLPPQPHLAARAGVSRVQAQIALRWTLEVELPQSLYDALAEQPESLPSLSLRQYNARSERNFFIVSIRFSSHHHTACVPLLGSSIGAWLSELKAERRLSIVLKRAGAATHFVITVDVPDEVCEALADRTAPVRDDVRSDECITEAVGLSVYLLECERQSAQELGQPPEHVSATLLFPPEWEELQRAAFKDEAVLH